MSWHQSNIIRIGTMEVSVRRCSSLMLASGGCSAAVSGELEPGVTGQPHGQHSQHAPERLPTGASGSCLDDQWQLSAGPDRRQPKVHPPPQELKTSVIMTFKCNRLQFWLISLAHTGARSSMLAPRASTLQSAAGSLTFGEYWKADAPLTNTMHLSHCAVCCTLLCNVRRNGYQLSMQLTAKPKGTVSIYPILDDQAGAC